MARFLYWFTLKLGTDTQNIISWRYFLQRYIIENCSLFSLDVRKPKD